MNFKPILFSTEMVQAILEGRKTQTRRIIFKNEPSLNKPDIICTGFTHGKKIAHFQGKSRLTSAAGKNPKYQPGDILWVRETWFPTRYDYLDMLNRGLKQFVKYKADGDYDPKKDCVGRSWKPSIHMPKAACRIFLEVTNVRVERLGNISEQDAIAEGILKDRKGWKCYTHSNFIAELPQESFKTLWQKINGLNSWNQNPWVWVYDFKRIEKPENFK